MVLQDGCPSRVYTGPRFWRSAKSHVAGLSLGAQPLFTVPKQKLDSPGLSLKPPWLMPYHYAEDVPDRKGSHSLSNMNFIYFFESP